jgi:Carboxypeptidase regulatory-like domain/TonB dependent receptor-like, beta-barrel
MGAATMLMHVKQLRLVLLSFLFMPTLALSQSQTGSLSGTILDSSGSAMSGAAVELRKGDTGLTLNTVTTDNGLYVFPAVPAGVWSILFQKTGFQRVKQDNIEIFIAQRQTVDITLQVGDVKQTLEVTSQQTQLDLETSERGQTFSRNYLQTLPLWSGGLQSSEAFLNYMPGVNAGAETSISGSTGRARESLIDGTSNVIPESGGTVFNPPSAEAFEEFKLLTDTYSAEYGRTGGGIEIFTSKSGTNGLHGTWTYNMRRDIWNAAGWSVNQNKSNAPGYRPKDRFNETGGGVGGPVYIPKIYDGRNKTFFYFSDDNDLRPVTPTSIVNTVPTTLETQGNFSQIPLIIYDPASTVGSGTSAVRTPFANNTIPVSRLSAVSSKIIPFIAAPTGSQLNSNHSYVNTQHVTDHAWTLKFDHMFSEKNRISYFQSLDSQTINTVSDFNGPLGTGLGLQYQKPQIFRVNHDYTISPTLLLHSTYGYSTTRQSWASPAQSGFASRIGLPLSGDSDTTPYISFAGADGYTSWGNAQGKVNSGFQNNLTHQFGQGLTWIHGKHEIKTGWEVRQMFTKANDLAGTNGAYTFARAETATPGALATSGNSFASFLLGLPDSASATALPVPKTNVRYQYYGFYLQDNWRVTTKLTLNLGFRYDIPINWYQSTMSSVSLTTPNSAAGNHPGALIFAGDGTGRSGLTRFWPTDYGDVGPRLGFAYRLTPKTVLRGGAGIFYEATSNGGCGCVLGAGGSFNRVSPDGISAPFQWDNGIPTPAGYKPPPFLSPTYGNGLAVDYMGPNFGKAPRIYNWSFNLQRELGKWLIDVAYVGNRGTRLNSTVDLNQVNPQYLSLGSLLGQQITSPAVVAAGFTSPYPGFTGTLSQALRPYPQYLNVYSRNSGQGRTWYDSGQFKVERRLGDWTFTATYVRSKTLGLLTYRQIFSQTQAFPQDMYNLGQGKSYLPFDQPNVFNVLNSYTLPLGRGKRFLSNANRFVNLLVGHWTIADSHNYHSGSLFALNCPNALGSGVLYTDALMCNTNPGNVLTGAARTSLNPNNPQSVYFASGVFSVPANFAFGTSSPYNGKLRQPPVFNDNVAIIKQFIVWPGPDGNRIRLQLRADAFNVLNRTNFGVNGTVGNPNFGRATGPQDGPRIITMGARVYF